MPFTECGASAGKDVGHLDMAAGEVSPLRIFSASLADILSSTSGSCVISHAHKSI